MYKVITMYDGCPGKELTTVIPTMPAVRRTIRELMRYHGFKFDDLAVIDLETGRCISFVL